MAIFFGLLLMLGGGWAVLQSRSTDRMIPLLICVLGIALLIGAMA